MFNVIKFNLLILIKDLASEGKTEELSIGKKGELRETKKTRNEKLRMEEREAETRRQKDRERKRDDEERNRKQKELDRARKMKAT